MTGSANGPARMPVAKPSATLRDVDHAIERTRLLAVPRQTSTRSGSASYILRCSRDIHLRRSFPPWLRINVSRAPATCHEQSHADQLLMMTGQKSSEGANMMASI